ncbi:transmembrane protein 180 [Erinaceus europaeus]|uniref:Transmembrane protein 180 n=1 Tax=Erinaceus europaeus TaxID=9365 RepID=A0A1S2ZB52_ERIEU|nr:transmembrane protein 180 [Erinaceus europaeus]
MTLSNVKSITWAYSLTTFGTEMLNSVFRFYYVKLFLHLYKISQVAFHQAQIILLIWNALNDLTGYFHNNPKTDCCGHRHSSVLYSAPFYALAFLLPWFPWKSYQAGDWLSGLHLVVSLCAFESALTFIQQARCVPLAEIFNQHESRLPFIKINQVASLVGSSGILFCDLVSDNMENLPRFQASAVVIATLAAASLSMGTCYLRRLQPPRSPEDSVWPGEQDLPWTSVLSLMSQILTQRNFRLFLIMNFFQVFHLTLVSNFMMIFADHLVPRDVLPSPIRSIMYGAGFLCPQCLVLVHQSWLKKFGYYKLILISFYLEGTASIVMLLLGQQRYYLLALYLIIIMVTMQASLCLFHLPLADVVDADLLKFSRQWPLSSMVFGINALFTKPAQALAPMVTVSLLAQYGYGSPNKSSISALHEAMFNLICLVPLGIAAIQILVWSPFSMKSKTEYPGAF